jgi:uncharacterized protein YxjI
MPQAAVLQGQDYPVQDEHGREMYSIGGRLNGPMGRFWIRDRTRRELAFVRENLSPEGLPVGFEIHYADELHSIVKRDKASLARCRFPHDQPAPDDLQAFGDLLNREYAFSRDDLSAATVTRHWFHSADVYSIDVARGEDEVLILAAALVVDLTAATILANQAASQPEIAPINRASKAQRRSHLYPHRPGRIASAH